jgi:hypothetical protein
LVLAFSFWNAFWVVLVCFVLVAILMMIGLIIVDIFCDPALSGLDRAMWILFLVLFSFVTVLVYVMMRGDGMADRIEERKRLRRST